MNTVNPHLITASQILRFTYTEDVVSFSLLRGRAEVMERSLGRENKVIGKNISEANFPEGLIVGAILRDEKVFIPTPETVLQENDHLVIFAKPNVCSHLDRCFMESVD
jgi:trk system potassium uptake protein